jgi:hypothetical protein
MSGFITPSQQTAIAAAVASSSRLIGSSGATQSVVTGNGTATTFPMPPAIAVPAGALSGANGVLELTVAVAANVSASVKTVKATLNNQDLGVTLQMAGQAAGEFTVRIQAKNATNAQQVRNTTAPTAAPTQTTVDMTQAQSITILGTLTTSGDTLNITGYSLRVSNV